MISLSKKFIGFFATLLFLLVTINSVYSADVYSTYKPLYTVDTPTDIYVSGYACNNTECTSVDLDSKVSLYNGDSIFTCVDTYNLNGNYPQLLSCFDSAAIDSDYYSISGDDYIVVKYDSEKSFGYLTYFSASDDEYFVNYIRKDNIVCNFDLCLDDQYLNVEFVKGNDAIAEIGNLNILNVDNKNMPVQVTVPVTISETVCSAYRLSNPNFWRATIPQGYSDYSAKTDVKLVIKNDDTGVEYFSQRITTSIFADNCATLNAFEWTPSVDLVNAVLEFSVESHVVDKQVLSSQKDYAYAYETMYPEDLESTCYARVQDFMLSNEPSFDLSSEVVRIDVGENLFANFKAGAFRDESVTPMDFDYNIYFDNNLVLTETGLNAGYDIESFNEDLTSYISGLSAGNHQVKVVVTPNGLNCDISNDVTQILNLELTNPETYDVTIKVFGDDGILVGANVEFDSMNLLTQSNGQVMFSEVLEGVYDYEVSYVGYETKFGTVVVGSDVSMSITLSSENSAPVVNFPNQFSEHYVYEIIVNVADYVVDYNEAFNSLDVNILKNSGSSVFNYNNGVLYFSSLGSSGTSSYSITVTDSSGESTTDTFDVVFTDNLAPSIITFSADSYDGYKVFTTNFNIFVRDADGDDMNCSINFGDGSVESADCAVLDGIAHSFTTSRDYNVVLTVTDSFGNVVTSDLDIYVYEEVTRPYVELFEVFSTNGNYVPTDLTFLFGASHDDISENIYCELIINGALNDVSCDGVFSILEYNLEGLARFEFVVRDDNGFFDNRIVTMNFESGEEENFLPFITTFDLTSSNGNFVPTDLSFDYVVGHYGDEQITCTIIVNSNINLIPCTLNSYDISNYVLEGEGTFELVVTDENGDFVSSTITQNFEREIVIINLPIINSFDMTSSNGAYLNTNLTFSFDYTYEGEGNLSCFSAVNDVRTSIDCENDFDVLDYDLAGAGKFELFIIDNLNNEISSVIFQSFSFENYLPFITSFDMVSSNGNMTPTDLTFDFVVGHNGDESFTCSLFVNNVESAVDCNSSFNILNFNAIGQSIFELVVTDSNGDSVSSIIYNTFDEVLVEIETLGINLLVDSNVELYKFDFSIKIEDESMAKRFVGLRPEIICDGSRAIVSEIMTREMAKGIYSSNDNNYVIDFELDTRDFNLHIREGLCELKIKLIDEFGTETFVSKFVRFEFPSEELKFTSIRGNGLDVMNYMDSVLSGTVRVGFNDIKFSVHNNEAFSKKLSITVIAPRLGINFGEMVSLKSGQSSNVQVPMFIGSDTPAGMYPVKYSINYGVEKYSRYSYIMIE